MKAKELMIGDKVMVKVLSQIPDTYVLHTWTANDYSRVLQVKPIPLTTEILEKNGWYYGLTSDEEEAEYFLDGCHYHRHWSYDEGAGSISLIFPNEADGGELIIDDQSFNRHLNLVFCDTLHVHELQHALRLCGLNELADNFKVYEE